MVKEMVGMSKLSDKEKREQRRRNHVARDLATPKYHQRIIERKRVEDEEGNRFFADRYHEDEVDW